MIRIKYSHPLQWPQDYPSVPKLEKSINRSFRVGLTIAEALNFLIEELEAIGNVQEANIFTDYESIDNPRQMKRVGSESGAVIAIKIDGQVYRLACDRWVLVEQNLYALHLALRNVRSIVEWGVGDIRYALGGYHSQAYIFTAAKSSGSKVELEDWRLHLGLGHTATLEDAHAVYRRRAKSAANDQEELIKLNLAMDMASKELG